MSEPEHLDLPDGYDPDGGWSVQEWWDALGYDDYGPLRPMYAMRLWAQQAAPGLLDGVDEQRDADFDDEETRP